MTDDPLISAALLGTARMTSLPPAPDSALEPAWQAISFDDPAAAALKALALSRALRRAGTKTQEASPARDQCPPETQPTLAAAAVDLAMRLLQGEFPEVLPEWVRLAQNSGRIVPARALPELLAAGTRDRSLRPAVRSIAGERGLWVARRHDRFAWLLEESAVSDEAWENGQPAERLAWLRQTRAHDPERAVAALAAHWPGESPSMREAILDLVVEDPLPVDEAWLEKLALKERRQELRERAATALAGLEGSAFRRRAIDRIRNFVTVERRLLKRTIVVTPPASFDPAWTADALKEKPPQGTGEKAWWLRQMVAPIPLSAWPEILGVDADDLFRLPIDADWKQALLLGWIDSARRQPSRALVDHFVRFVAAIEPWPPSAPAQHTVLHGLLDVLPVGQQYDSLATIAEKVPAPLALDLLAHCRQPPPPGTGKRILALIDRAIAASPSVLTRHQARALAVCVPPTEIQVRLESLARRPELTGPAEEFAATLEFRRSLISTFSSQ